MEGNSNFKITISFHSSIFGMEGYKMEWNGMEGNSNAASNNTLKMSLRKNCHTFPGAQGNS